MKAKDKEISNHALCSFYDVLRDWLTIIIHDLIILNQYPQENIKHLVRNTNGIDQLINFF